MRSLGDGQLERLNDQVGEVQGREHTPCGKYFPRPSAVTRNQPLADARGAPAQVHGGVSVRMTRQLR